MEFFIGWKYCSHRLWRLTLLDFIHLVSDDYGKGTLFFDSSTEYKGIAGEETIYTMSETNK